MTQPSKILSLAEFAALVLLLPEKPRILDPRSVLPDVLRAFLPNQVVTASLPQANFCLAKGTYLAKVVAATNGILKVKIRVKRSASMDHLLERGISLN